MHSYGHDVRLARYRRDWTRERLAEETGLSVKEINAIENGEADPTPVLAALQLVEVTMLVTDLAANFLRVLQNAAAKVPEDRVPLVQAAVLDVVGRAVAGIDPTPTVGQFNLIHGVADIDNDAG